MRDEIGKIGIAIFINFIGGLLVAFDIWPMHPVGLLFFLFLFVLIPALLFISGLYNLLIVELPDFANRMATPQNYLCSKCKSKIHWIENNMSWYCYTCKSYVSAPKSESPRTITDDGKHWLEDSDESA